LAIVVWLILLYLDILISKLLLNSKLRNHVIVGDLRLGPDSKGVETVGSGVGQLGDGFDGLRNLDLVAGGLGSWHLNVGSSGGLLLATVCSGSVFRLQVQGWELQVEGLVEGLWLGSRQLLVEGVEKHLLRVGKDGLRLMWHLV
jgi:hypothetical protein